MCFATTTFLSVAVMGLTKHILHNVIRNFFCHLPWRGEGKNSWVKVIKSYQIIILIKLYQSLKLIRLKKVMDKLDLFERSQSKYFHVLCKHWKYLSMIWSIINIEIIIIWISIQTTMSHFNHNKMRRKKYSKSPI